MIKSCITVEIKGRTFEYCAELSDVATWADTPEETAIGLLNGQMDQLYRALAVDRPEPLPPAEEVTNASVTAAMGDYDMCLAMNPKGLDLGPCTKPKGHVRQGDIFHRADDAHSAVPRCVWQEPIRTDGDIFQSYSDTQIPVQPMDYTELKLSDRCNHHKHEECRLAVPVLDCECQCHR
jgi:hypothetical protein